MEEPEFQQWGAVGPLLRDGFSVVPNIVLRDRTLSGLAKAAWALVYDYSHRKVNPELTALQDDLGVGEKSARAALRELETAGLLERKRNGRGLPNSYRLVVPEDKTLPTEGSRTAPGTDPTRTRVSREDELQDGEVEADASTSHTGRTGRRRNVVFDALVEATAANPADQGGEIGKAAKAIRTAEADRVRDLSQQFLADNPEQIEVPAERIDKWLAAQIQHRAAEYRRLRPEWELTPSALAKHWNRIPTWKTRGGGRMSAAEIARLEE